MSIEVPNVASPNGHQTVPLLGQSAGLKHARRLIKTASNFEVPVLLTGESGTGKEIAARSIHAGSIRNDRPFVPVNCGAIPEGLVESELFGHSKGAFTGATESRDGAFVLADGGTILLDEIGDFRIDLQVKLVRVLQEKRVLPLGTKGEQDVNVRVIASTNQKLSDEKDQGRFRRDLYYRLAVFPIHLPPLRDREGDVALLSRHFMQEFAHLHQRSVHQFSREALHLLEAWLWPGNVRELRNVIERAVILATSDEIDAHCLPIEIQHGGAGKEAPVSLAISGARSPDWAPRHHLGVPRPHPMGTTAVMAPEEILPMVEEERRIISRALSHGSWNVPHVAQRLGMSRATLYRRMRKLGLSRSGFQAGDEASA